MCFILITVLLRNRCLNRDQLLRKIKWKKALTVLKTDKTETKAANKKDQQGLTVIILSSVKWMDSRFCTTQKISQEIPLTQDIALTERQK